MTDLPDCESEVAAEYSCYYLENTVMENHSFFLPTKTISTSPSLGISCSPRKRDSNWWKGVDSDLKLQPCRDEFTSCYWRNTGCKEKLPMADASGFFEIYAPKGTRVWCYAIRKESRLSYSGCNSGANSVSSIRNNRIYRLFFATLEKKSPNFLQCRRQRLDFLELLISGFKLKI